MVMMAVMAANADRPDSDIGGKTAAALERIGAVRRQVVQASATQAGLSVLQAEIVRLLASGAVRPRGTDLAVELAVSLPTVSDAVSALRRKGLVTHRPGADARSKELRLTAVGRALAASLDDALAGFRRAAGAAGDQGLAAALAVIEGLWREGMIAVDRSCVTCAHHVAGETPAGRCALLGRELTPATLRVDCPEHAAA